MKQKLVFLFSIALTAIIVLGFIPRLGLFDLFYHNATQEGFHSKTVHAPDAITCPDGMILFVAAGCTIPVTTNTPTSNCNLTFMSYSVDGGPVQTVSPLPSGDYPTTITLGSYGVDTFNVVWQVNDNCVPPTNATCNQTIMIRDNILPSISCPANVSVGNSPDGRKIGNRMMLTFVNVGQPLFSDNCTPLDRLLVRNDYNNTEDASDFYPLGTTPVIWTVTDASGNSRQCAMTVTVYDNTPPDIICPDTIRAECISPQPFLFYKQFQTAGGSAIDDIMLDTSTFRWVNDISNRGTCPEIIRRRYTISDTEGNADTCFQIIVLRDITVPTAVCRDITVYLNESGEATISPALLNNGSTDNCSDPLIFTTSINPFFSCNDVVAGVPLPYTLIVTDSCGNSSTCTSIITVRDTIPPAITCPAPRNADLNNSCIWTVPDYRSLATRSDNCSFTTITQTPSPGSNIPSSPNQTHPVTFVVTDIAGLSASCSFVVTTLDNLGPDIVCRQPRVISLSDDPEIPASSFITSAMDNCGGTLRFSARRMGNICGSNIPDDFSNYVIFCCDDVNNTVNIIVRVEDERGNFTECMTSVIVQDKLAPEIVHPLPDISISCEYPINLSDLSVFGTFVSSGAVRNNIVVNDPGQPFYSPLGYAGQDGVYGDNCPLSGVSFKVRDLRTSCHTGQIKRDFTITDNSGNIVTYTQTIYVIDVDPFDITDITWPNANVDFFECNINDPDSNVTGRPALYTDQCSLAGATYSDQVFSHPVYCRYIRRTWTVLDWCQYRTNTPGSPGKWTFVQNIYVRNTVPPVINNAVCKDTVICTSGAACTADISFTASGTDDCLPVNITWTYKIDLDNNGGNPDISGSGPTFTRTFNMGTHKLTWEAKDGCSNVSTCSYVFSVKDCKAPVAVAMKGLAINLTPPMGMASIKAIDFNNFSSDNCTPVQALRYSFSADTTDKVRTFTCDSIGQRVIELWVTDLAGNQTKATTFISVQDNQQVCGNSGRLMITGKVYTEDKINIPDTKILIDGGETEGFTMTDAQGSFTFRDLAKYNDYQLIPVKNTNHPEGITTLDLVLIQRHILGIKTLDSPYKLIAADANNSGSITAADLVEIRKVLLGIQKEFNHNESWRFVDAAYIFTNPEHPWPYSEKINYENIASDMRQSDMIAIKTGDVNGSAALTYEPYALSRNNETVTLYAEDQNLQAGMLASIPVTAHDLNGFLGIQGTFEFDKGISFVGIEGINLNIRKENFNKFTKDGAEFVTFSMDDMNGFQLDHPSILFNVVVKADQATSLSRKLKLSSRITQTSAINSEEKEVNLKLAFKAKSGSESSFVLQNQPNPFREGTTIPFSLEKGSVVTATIYDTEGKQLYESSQTYESGSHAISFQEKHFANKPGVFYCRVKSNAFNRVIKMLRIE